MTANIFVTGTDTDVGKTVISSWICLHTNAIYWKPIQTGNDSDKDVVRKISPNTKTIPEKYKLKTPLSPYDAAKLENVKIDGTAFKIDVQNAVIEGAGGVLVPITEDFLMVDLIESLCPKVVIVAKSKLGMINHALMTAEILRNRGISVLGFVITGDIEANLKTTIEMFSKLKILSVVPHSNSLVETLRNTALPLEIKEILR
jgi:dethiobiotin synthase